MQKSEPSSMITMRICTEVAPQVCSGSILLQKSFWGDERNFLQPLMRFARGDVRDHIVSSKIDQGPPWWPRKATQGRGSLKIDFREIFRVARFSTFATILARSGRSWATEGSARVQWSGPTRFINQLHNARFNLNKAGCTF